MSHWNTKDIVALLSALPCVESIGLNGQGGDYDTQNLIVKVKGVPKESLWICGFDDECDGITSIDDTPIKMIELTDGLSSAGGLNSRNRVFGHAYIEVKGALEDAGHEVVDRMKDYF